MANLKEAFAKACSAPTSKSAVCAHHRTLVSKLWYRSNIQTSCSKKAKWKQSGWRIRARMILLSKKKWKSYQGLWHQETPWANFQSHLSLVPKGPRLEYLIPKISLSWTLLQEILEIQQFYTKATPSGLVIILIKVLWNLKRIKYNQKNKEWMPWKVSLMVDNLRNQETLWCHRPQIQ